MPRPLLIRALTLFLVVLPFSAHAAQRRVAADAVPVVSFNASTVQVAPVTPKGSVLVYGFAMEPRGWNNAIVRRATYLTDSGAGSVQWTLDNPVPVRSVWFAVDLSNGLTAAAYPDGFRAESFDLDDKNLRKGISGDIEQLATLGFSADFAVIRPGEGVWARYAHWDATQDQPGEHGTIKLDVYGLLPVAGTTAPPPKKLKNGDIVLITTFAVTTRYAIGVVK